MLPLISVIVPVYKVEPYLDQCVESIVKQTYTNLEIILIDDGSPDNCPAMCDEWAKKDSRIKIIHKENGGLSDARNAGMAVATGEYIGFVDSDDWIHEDMYRLLYENMLEKNSDISACDIEIFFDNNDRKQILSCHKNITLSTEEALSSLINETLLLHPVVYKLYKRTLIQSVNFPINKCHEDNFWTYQAISKAKTISIIDTPCYFYRQRSNSIMNSTYSLKRLDALEAKYSLLTYINNNHPSLITIANLNFWFSCIYSYQMSLKYLHGNDFIVAKNKILEAKKHSTLPTFSNDMNFKQKVWLILSRISFVGTCHLRNILKIGF